MTLRWIYSNLENEVWTPEQGPSINPDPPEDFQIQKTGDALQIYLRGAQGVYGGALAKGVKPLPTQGKKITLSLEVFFNQDLLEFGQVLEMDTKFTDYNGWTYPGDYQILVKNGQQQIGNPWQNWGGKRMLFVNTWNEIRVSYELDYKNHTIKINDFEPFFAVDEGWEPNEIVNQLQLCSNSKAGFHNVYYRNISVEGEW